MIDGEGTGMLLELLTREQLDAAAEYGLATHAFFRSREERTPDPVWRRYLATRDRLARALADGLQERAA